jgi:hypothetical protein
MGVRGKDQLLAALPPTAAASAVAVLQGLADLQSLRHSALGPEDVRALSELWERVCAMAGAGRLALFAAIDARDDVIPKTRVGDASAVFAAHNLGQRRGTARRDALWASLLRAEVGDLPAVGAAYAAGDITPAHVEVAVRTHKQLGAAVRDAVVDGEVPDDDGDPDGQLRAALASLTDAFTARVRRIRVVDVMLAHYARRHTVTELEAIADRIVATLNPPDPKGAHERRYLNMSQLPSGEWRGRFSCGPAQGLLIKRALTAFGAPRPGKAIDTDGVERTIPDTRDLGARQMDAATDIVTLALAKTGITLPASPNAVTRPGHDAQEGRTDGCHAPTGEGGGEGGGESSGKTASEDRGGKPDEPYLAEQEDEPDEPLYEPLDEPPPGEGEPVVVRQPGVLAGPYPSVDLVLIAGIEHVAAAWAHQPAALPLDFDNAFNTWLRDRLRTRNRTKEESAEKAPCEDERADEEPGDGRANEETQSLEWAPPEEQPREQPGERPGESPRAGGGIARGEYDCRRDSGCGPKRDDGDPARPGWLRRALSPYAVPARLEHAGPVDANTLELLACTATIRAAVLAPGGALLDLGRTQRLASPAQKTALLARDGGCIIPGCTVPGDACDAHHIQWWTRGGATDLENLALVCGRHHTEVHQETWEITMRDGVPWVTPPTWIDPAQRPLRNAAHHPRNNRTEGP